jgi:hypothetical protein
MICKTLNKETASPFCRPFSSYSKRTFGSIKKRIPADARLFNFSALQIIGVRFSEKNNLIS